MKNEYTLGIVYVYGNRAGLIVSVFTDTVTDGKLALFRTSHKSRWNLNLSLPIAIVRNDRFLL